MKDLQWLLQEITDKWVSAKQQPFTNHSLASQFRNDLVNVVREIVDEYDPILIIKGSVGAGNWANVPWLSILDPEITNSTQDGIYPVYLFKADGSGVYLSLNQGTTAPTNKLGKKKAQEQALALAQIIRSEIPQVASWGEDKINLSATSSLGQSYEAPNIVAKYYPADAIPDTPRLKQDLLEILGFYNQTKSIWNRINTKDNTRSSNLVTYEITHRVSKPFVLLAGISGTGKTRFVRYQACQTGSLEETYCLVPVRPDWHEPSDLLGYISRLGAKGPRYVVTDILRFIVNAWKEIVDKVEDVDGKLNWVGKCFDDVRPYWLCLDEMNLAPVEQYFSDFLSVLETRSFYGEEELQQYNADNGLSRPYIYHCDAILKPELLDQLDGDGLHQLRSDLGLEDRGNDGLWQYFISQGISLPFNLIVAGTVNMDETTHGFSRKVIDRAMSIDFGEFFPNDFDQYFEPESQPVALGYPLLTSVSREDFKTVLADPDGNRSIDFLNGINEILKGSPFELAYRALNELLLSVISQAPADDSTLYAVWDDFIMMKVLPRIDGDQEKLSVPFFKVDAGVDESIDLLGKLESHLKLVLTSIWDNDRPDLLRVAIGGDDTLMVDCRSKRKIIWMRQRLKSGGFTSFWP